MHLWNDYEGATLAGQWKLGKLLRTEGRSALFATTKPDGASAVLRLTEALNDQAVLRARYQSIQAAGDRFLVKVESFGDAEFDGTPLSYAVLEPTQESLADILATRRLVPDEVQEVATVVAGGLHALHTQGLVHGLVEPASVLAAGDQIKLRSDCARPAPSPEDAELENAVTPKTDAWGLAGILYQSLTQNRLHDAADALALPEPYATIVRQTARGAWGVPEIEAELQRHTRAQAPPAPAPTPAPAAKPIATPAADKPSVAGSTSGAHPAETAVKPSAPIVFTEIPTPSSEPFSSRASIAKTPEPAFPADTDRWMDPKPAGRSRLLGIGLAVAALVLALLVFGFVHSSGQKTATTPQPTSSTAPAPKPTAAGTAPLTTTASPAAAGPAAAPSERDVWRVVAYTYNHRALADRKAAQLNEKHPNFRAEAWTPTGKRPFLVTLGGPMLKNQAVELRALALKAGVSRDVYAQNYAR